MKFVLGYIRSHPGLHTAWGLRVGQAWYRASLQVEDLTIVDLFSWIFVPSWLRLLIPAIMEEGFIDVSSGANILV